LQNLLKPIKYGYLKTEFYILNHEIIISFHIENYKEINYVFKRWIKVSRHHKKYLFMIEQIKSVIHIQLSREITS